MSQDDRELIARCQAGDLQAFEPLVEKYRQRVWRLALHILRDREEALDVAQETFVRAFQSIREFRGQSAFYTWVFRIAVNLATDRHRKTAARARAFGAEAVPEEEWERVMPDPAARPDLEATRAEERAKITRALDALPRNHRTIIMLSDIEGLSYREIAEVLRCPIGTVMSRLHNARKRLRALLGPLLLLLAAPLFLLAWAAPTHAQQMIRFGGRILLASDPPPVTVQPSAPSQRSLLPPSRESLAPEADERLAPIIPKLRALFRYRDYTSIERFRADVAIGAQQRFTVPGARQLEVTPSELSGKAVRMKVRLLRGDLPELNADIKVSQGQPALIGGPPFGDGVLIIILWAHPNP
ncbi:MAG: sigma-70 family RNA polymerase sigma factor [Candidatus Rokubacteria bacterium]|nr:sigma-70 family RNA polymerase sigma factor [Candidatus Rokubacteria bacterium]